MLRVNSPSELGGALCEILWSRLANKVCCANPFSPVFSFALFSVEPKTDEVPLEQALEEDNVAA
ncbi:hypothetical protein LR48_Vigan03g090100 [Vigna angularis]|uniref:Uncharacterized protein n=1 Tax=Phaseolus angularis TaxID=3914 RepID=A0A0L9U550_PHAAN|nr:hypothetical protein LR48_Vigan03g090100 [Vigna angularis]